MGVALPPAVIADMQGGIDVAITVQLFPGQRLYRFSSSHLFDKGFYVSPWWMDSATVTEITGEDPSTMGAQRAGARARSGLAVPPNWRGRADMNYFDVLVGVTLRRSVVAFRGPGKDQYGAGGKIVRAPRNVIQIFIPELSSRMTPPPTLQTALALFSSRETLNL
jgi:hypothetical protein